ncbi:MAG: PQQ-binding-like beta-propeller repeat protein [Pirellulaceae bacterium]|nr:PQQ-binding-like beta-propeller repeat protein [Pirellulaceae bacterium]
MLWSRLVMLLLGVWGGPFACTAVAAEQPVSSFSTDGRNVYRLATAELDRRSDARETVGSTYDGRVCAFDAGGKHLWDASVGGFVFDLASGDLDGDGDDEILAACADGHVYALDADGQLLWKQDLGAPVWQVTVARVAGHTRVALAGGISRKVFAFAADGTRVGETRGPAINGAVRLMRAGDFDGDGTDEVAVLPVRGQAKDLVFLDVPGLAPRKERITFEMVPWDASSAESKKVGERFRSGKRPWTTKSLLTANGIAGDLDGDGAHELIFNPGVYSLKGGLRQTVKFPEPFKVPSYDQFYKMRMVAAGDLTDAPGAEIVLLEGCEVRLLDNQGNLLGAAAAPLGFTDVIYVPGSPRGHVLLGSSPNGDDNVYRLRFDAGWEKSLMARASTPVGKRV